jgi:uncharacterized repeat protein (TIGR03803 family)
VTRWNLSHCALSLCVAAALLAACGTLPLSLSKGQDDMQPPIGASGAMPRAAALAVRANSSTNYDVLYNFAGGIDGANPTAGLIDVGGTLYGTTSAGGSYSCGYYGGSGCGTVFNITLGGTEKVLHSFASAPDGATPYASLIELNGTLYGTTFYGGSHPCYGFSYANCGTVFSITPSGAEKVLYSFDGNPDDGAYPNAALIDVSGTLYGTTSALYCRGAYGACGTVFKITTTGTESVLHTFGSYHEGAYPLAGLIDVGGKLYGTTESGGRHRSGTVFSITLGGKAKVLHSFGEGADGANPVATLVELKGTLYGTTRAGGAYGVGTVFSITPDGKEKVLHSFGNGTDGAHPLAPLTELKGMLYGTTSAGGSGLYSECYISCGTVFSITPSGKERVLYSFQGFTDHFDGDYPASGLLNLHGTLYGTTMFGGRRNDGTIFSLKP